MRLHPRALVPTRQRSLARSILGPAIVLAAIPFASGCLDAKGSSDCLEHVQRTLHVSTPADPPMQFRIDRCLVDVDACRDVCALALQRAEIFATPLDCRTQFSSDDVQLRVTYEIRKDGFNCPVDVPSPQEGGVK